MLLSHRGTLIKKLSYAPQLYDTWRVWKLGHFTILYIFVSDVGLSLSLIPIWIPQFFELIFNDEKGWYSPHGCGMSVDLHLLQPDGAGLKTGKVHDDGGFF